jgi:hypothetical protein
MDRKAQLFQRLLFVVGVLSAICTCFTQRASFTPWLFGTSVLCFLVMPFSVFLRPKTAWMSGLIHGGIVLVTYALTMPLWGRLWYREGASEDWKLLGVFIVIGLNFVLPCLRGLTFKKSAV